MSEQQDHIVVGIGASAGGLDAIQELFDHLPDNTGLSFVIVQHLAPEYKSLMPELLGKHTQMPIATAQDGQILLPDHIYLNSSGNNLQIHGRQFQLTTKTQAERFNLPIDLFFHSLSQSFKELAVGVVLSGTGTDGSRGVASIKANDGTVLVQKPTTAQFDGMPKAAISSGCADSILPPSDIARQLVKLSRFHQLGENEDGDGLTYSPIDQLQEIVDMLTSYSGIHYHYYKRNTIQRRVEKRMLITRKEHIQDYLKLLRSDAKEREILAGQMLIGVTQLFRDPKVFQFLEEKVIPELLAERPIDRPIRLWIPACSTGEEAYSFAILLDYLLQKKGLNNDFRIFATDVDEKALGKAAEGNFRIEQKEHLPPHLFKDYFIASGDSFQIVPRIREKLVFSRHDCLVDPPFIRMDLISCRNLMIYLNSKAQSILKDNLAFSLEPKGFLILGSSETLGEPNTGFSEYSSSHHIYRSEQQRNQVRLQRDQPQNIESSGKLKSVGQEWRPVFTTKNNEVPFLKYISARFSPDLIFINADLEVLYIEGQAGRYLKHLKGGFRSAITDMVSPELATLIREGVKRMQDTHEDIVVNLPSISGETVELLRIHKVRQSHALMKDCMMLQFGEKDAEEELASSESFELNELQKSRTDLLEEELADTRNHLQNLIEELETSNEELQASNEELQASNEELQSTNEELQSVNEELYTVNSELQERNQELLQLNDDLNNLMDSTRIATLFLDEHLGVRRFTPSISSIYNLTRSDIGRHISHFAGRLQHFDDRKLLQHCHHVLESGEDFENQVTIDDGRVFLLRIRPYNTVEGRIAGLVLSFVDITQLVENQQSLYESQVRHELVEDAGNLILFKYNTLTQQLDNAGSYERVMGLSGEKPLESWLAHIHEADRERVMATMQRLFKGEIEAAEEHYAFLNPVEKKDMYIQTRVKLLDRNPQGIPETFVGVSVDVTDLWTTREELKKALYTTQKVTESSPNGVFVYSMSSHEVLFSNSSLYRILGRSLEEINSYRGKGFWDLIHPEDHAAMAHTLEKVGRGADQVHLEFRFQSKSENWIWVFLQLAPFASDDEGMVREIVGVLMDVTHQKEAEFALQENSQRLENVIKGTHIGTWDWNIPSGEVVFNERWAEIAGYTLEDLSPLSMETWTSLMHPDDLTLSNSLLEKVFHQELDYYECECRVQHKEGHWVWVLDRGAVMEWDAEGNPVRMSGTHQDISELKQAVENIQFEKDRMVRLFEASATAILIFNKEGVVTKANERSQELLGAPIDQIIGKKYNDSAWSATDLSGNVIPDEALPFSKVLTTGKPLFDALVVISENKVLSANASPVFDSQQQVEEVIMTVADITVQHQLQIELKNQLDTISLATEISQLGIWQWDAQTDQSIFNPRNAEIYGYKGKDATAFWAENLFPDDRARAIQELQDYIDGKTKMYDSHYRYVHPLSKEVVYLHVIGHSTARDAEGKTLHMIGVTLDETASKHQEHKLEVAVQNEKKVRLELENQLHLIELAVEAAGLGLWQWDPQKDETVANEQYWSIMGLPQKGISGVWMEHLHGEDRERVLAEFEAHIKGETPRYSAEYRYTHPISKEERVIKTTGLVVRRKPNGEALLMIGVATDITDLRSQERALQQALHFTERITQSSNQGIFVFDVALGQNIYCNEPYASVVGYDCQAFNEAIAGGLIQVFHPDDLQALEENMHELVYNGKGHRNELRIKAKDGHYHWFQLEQTPFETDDQGRTTKILGLIQNIDDRKQMELDLIASKRKAEAANVYKNSFISNMSHEIRTPMNGVVACSQLLRDDHLSAEERDQFIDIIQSSSKQLLHLVDDIIDVARMETGELKLNKEKFKLGKVLDELFNTFEQLRKSNKLDEIVLVLEVSKEVAQLEIETDPFRLKQILTNLLGNAFKFCTKGKVTLGAEIHQQALRFFVSDEGVGVAPEKHQEIFERFSQIEYTAHTKFGGKGLGLNISRGLAELLGATLTIESTLGKGANFYLNFPKSEKLVQGHEPPQEIAFNKRKAPDLQKVSILYADDEENLRFYLNRVLAPTGARLLEAQDGQEAVELYEKHHPDVVLMDIRMPNKDGFEATKEILQLDPQAQIIMQTAYALPEERRKAAQLGCVDYLTKPLDRDLLYHTIASHLKTT